jgi:hypothetical protein
MLENVLHKMGLEVFGVISISMFFAFFTGVLVWAFRLKKNYLTSMCELPLDTQPAPESTTPSPGGAL